jgi:hypothetical protein
MTSINDFSGDGSYPAKAKAAFPLLFIVLISAIIGWVLFGCMSRFSPIAGSRAGGVGALSRYAANSNFLIGAVCIQAMAFILIIISSAVDTWSFATLSTSGVNITYNFGVVGARVAVMGQSKFLTYSCSGITTNDQKQFCVSYLLGSFLTIGYEALGMLFALIALVYGIQGKRTGFWSSRVWSCTGLALVCAIASLFDWALTTHLCLETMLSGGNDGGASMSLMLGVSWALVFPIIACLTFNLIYFRAVIEFTPITGAAVQGIAMQPSPLQFSPTIAMGQPQPYPTQPQQQYAEYPVQQQQYGQQPMYNQQPVVYGQTVAYGQQSPPPQQQQQQSPQAPTQQQDPTPAVYPSQEYAAPPVPAGPPSAPMAAEAEVQPSAEQQGYVAPQTTTSDGFTQI